MRLKKKYTAQALAEFCGCSIQNISQSKRRGLLIADETGNYPTSEQINRDFIAQRRKAPARPGRKSRASTSAEREHAYTMREINMRIKEFETHRKEIEIAAMRGELLPVDYTKRLFRHLEKFNSTIERIAGVLIEEVGQKILESGEVKPEHVEIFLKATREAVQNARAGIVQDIKNFTPEATR